MDLQSILAALLNPNGMQQAPQMAGAPAQVGDHANPALLQQQRLAQPPQMQPQQQAMPPQAPQGQPMPQGAPQAPPQPQGGGLGGLGGILQNIISPQSAQKNQTVGWLTSQGLDPGTATVLASDKGALRQYIMSRSQGQKPIEIAGRLVDPNDYHVIADFSDKGDKDKPPASYQEFQLAKQDGYKGSYVDWQTKSVREQDPTFGREKDLRQEYENNPNVKNYQIVRDNYERIRQGAQQTTGAGDLAIVFGYMKMLDPTSVVRENEQASAENTAGVPAAVRNTYNRIMSGEKLSPEARQQMLAAAQQIYAQSSQNLGDLNKRYSGIASNYQLDPARVVQVPEQYDPLAPPPIQQGGDLPLPPPQDAPLPNPGPGDPASVTPQGQQRIQNLSNPAPIVDWKTYFGKKAR